MTVMGEQAAPTTKRGLLVWGLALWLATAVFFLFISVCAYFYDYFPADVRIAHAIEGVDVPAFGGFMHFMNVIGDTKMYIIFVLGFAIGLAVLRAGWESVLVLLTVVPNGAGVVMKDWVRRPRPSPRLIHVSAHEAEFSFPSGHTLKTAAVFLVLFFVIPAVVPWRPARWALMAVCLLFIVAAGPARVYVGAHWPSDVLGSYLLAFLFMAPPLATLYYFQRPKAESRS